MSERACEVAVADAQTKRERETVVHACGKSENGWMDPNGGSNVESDSI